MLKKCDISGSEVSTCIGRVATVITSKAGITKEDVLRGLSRKFFLAKSEYVDKKSTAENTWKETKKGLIRKEKRMRNLITQYRRRHVIDQIANGLDSIPLKTLRNCMVEEKSASCIATPFCCEV